MITRLAQKTTDRAALKARKQQIEQCLAELGLIAGPRRLARGEDVSAYEDAHSRRLCAALKKLGPVFSNFGICLSSRVDLLPVSYSLDLASIPDKAEATPMVAIRDLFVEQTGCLISDAFTAFEESPFESRLLFQSHRAWLKDGTEVTVKVVHPELQEHHLYDEELLTLLEGVFSGRQWAGIPIERAIADFRRGLKQQLDLTVEAEAIKTMAADSKEFEMLKAPAVFNSFCSSKVLTIERLPGLTLAEAIFAFNGEPRLQTTAPDIDLKELARCIYRVWLIQAFMGHLFPVEPRPENILILPNKKIAFTGGSFSDLSPDAKVRLWNYLLATSSENPDKACGYLLEEMGESRIAGGKEALKHKLRQVVPFRDGGWNNTSGDDNLAERVFVQWKLAGESGFYPPFHLLCFYRGLFQIAALAERLAPEDDSLAAAVAEVRLVRLLGQFNDMVDPRQVGDNLDKYAAMMIEMPRKIDEVLTLVSEGNARLRLQATQTAASRGDKNSPALVVALLLTLAAVALLSHRFATIWAWSEQTGAVLFILLGAMLLRAASRAR